MSLAANLVPRLAALRGWHTDRSCEGNQVPRAHEDRSIAIDAKDHSITFAQ
jgi:hypothetical protein